MEENRTCFNCVHLKLCYKYRDIHAAGAYGFNIDSNDAPGKWTDIFKSLANACLDFSIEKKP